MIKPDLNPGFYVDLPKGLQTGRINPDPSLSFSETRESFETTLMALKRGSTGLMIDPPMTEREIPSEPIKIGKGSFHSSFFMIDLPDIKTLPNNYETATFEASPKDISGSLTSALWMLDPPLQNPSGPLAEQIKKYKEDQLLSNPGGDDYFLDRPHKVMDPNYNHESFVQRIGKDLKDAFDNVVNFFKDLLFGSQYRYISQDGRVKFAKKKGLLGTVVEFFKDVASAFSFGTWRPDKEPEPKGFLERAAFFVDKLGEAVAGDLVLGIPGSVIDLTEDLVLAGWNLIEILPDATIGNFKEGRKLTTTIFDNGQVVIDYLTDIIPTGEAWVRVHAMDIDSKGIKLPILFNLQTPEQGFKDMRWETVRNTPFRKAIETIGSILADIFVAKFVGQSIRTSRKRHHSSP